MAQKALWFVFVFFLLGRIQVFADSRPNVLFIIADDQRTGELGELMPQTQSRIFDVGVRFEKAYATTPACSPSRASIFTGLYASQHKVLWNNYLLERETAVRDIQNAGYETALFGKYLNTWNGTPRPEFDRWLSFAGGSTGYVDPRLNVDGLWSAVPGYMTDILAERLRDFLKGERDEEKPFFAVFAPTAPHPPYQAKEGTEEFYASSLVPRTPNFNERDLSDKPLWLQTRGRERNLRSDILDENYRERLRMLWTLDQAIGRVLDTLEETKQLENTCIFYISDNGRLLGEHQLVGKDAAYEESVHVPFALRCPGQAPGVRQELVANIDLMPTVFDLLSLTPSYPFQGRSLQDLFRSEILEEKPWREELLLEAWRAGPVRPFVALHRGSHVLIRYKNDRREFYDLEKDPYELQNAAGAGGDLQQEMSGELRDVLLEVRGSTSFREPVGVKGPVHFSVHGAS